MKKTRRPIIGSLRTKGRWEPNAEPGGPHTVSNGAVAVRLKRNQHGRKHLRVLPPLLNPLSNGAVDAGPISYPLFRPYSCSDGNLAGVY
jgi:hypothetical protein